MAQLSIRLVLEMEGRSPVTIAMERTESFSYLFETFADITDDRRFFRFIYGGTELEPDNTPLDMEMDNDDTIDVELRCDLLNRATVFDWPDELII